MNVATFLKPILSFYREFSFQFHLTDRFISISFEMEQSQLDLIVNLCGVLGSINDTERWVFSTIDDFSGRRPKNVSGRSTTWMDFSQHC